MERGGQYGNGIGWQSDFAREAEIGDDSATGTVGRRDQHDIPAFQIAMNHSGAMRGMDPFSHLVDERERFRLIQPAMLSQSL